MSDSNFEKTFLVVDIEGMRLSDSVMNYKPKHRNEKRVMNNVIQAMKSGMKNFRIPAMDPSFEDDGETIIYCAGRKPAVGKSPLWWYENALKFMPEKNSCLCNELDDDVVLLVMCIKSFVKIGYTVAEAWQAVCVNSKGIGHFADSVNAKKDFEPTGSRRLGDMYDLGNTGKIIKVNLGLKLELRGGNYKNYGRITPLASAIKINDFSEDYNRSVGRIKLDV